MTTIILDNNPPTLPTSYLRLDNFYQITSTAQVTGSATVAMSYADAEIAATAESHIAMLLYDAAKAQWENVTISRDATNKVVSGQGVSSISWGSPIHCLRAISWMCVHDLRSLLGPLGD